MHLLNKISLIFLSSLLLLLEGCGGDSKKSYPTAISESASLITSDPNAAISLDTEVSQKISTDVANMLSSHINELNTQEATLFTKETNYCDISGEKIMLTQGSVQNITANLHFKSCVTQNNTQDGQIELFYAKTNSDGKFPEEANLTVYANYQFNSLELKKEVHIESVHICYDENKSIEQMILKVTGDIAVDKINYTLKNFEVDVKDF